MPPFFRRPCRRSRPSCWSRRRPPRADGQVIVKFAPGKARTSAMPSGARLVNTIHALGAQVVRTTGDPAAAAAALNRSRRVEYAEADASCTPRDPERPALRASSTASTTPARPAASPTPTSTPPRAGTPPASAPSRDRRRQGRHRRHRHRPRPTRTSPARSSTAASPAAAGRDHRPARAPTTTATARTSPARSPANANNGMRRRGRRVQLAAVDLQGAQRPARLGHDGRRRELHHLGRRPGREGDLDEPRRRRVDDAAERGANAYDDGARRR